ncbi:hypothetical protein OIU78_015649 [Salix suchowensis]|uniref:Uncharacterized protein n=1 Tax=Salix purpurea TaxID=77065 RepID=A0A9Q0SJI2_SALPP|nr:hypothetical protein OIU78_015649 [Salix suchowensis]KAJ6679742.1 hypothetical protein OIU79_019468 [Salix purpurea]
MRLKTIIDRPEKLSYLIYYSPTLSRLHMHLDSLPCSGHSNMWSSEDCKLCRP